MESTNSDTNSDSQLQSAGYDSNPFRSALVAIRSLFVMNTSTLIGIVLFMIPVYVVMGLSLVAIVFAGVGFIINHGQGGIVPLYGSYDLFKGVGDLSLYATIIIGTLLIAFLLGLARAIELKLTLDSARNHHVSFGEVLKVAARRAWKLIILGLLVAAVMLVAIITLALLSVVIGPITLAIGFAAIVAAIYIGLRLTYATYTIVDKGYGPIGAIKHSWQMTKGHMTETLGSLATAGLLAAAPSIVLGALLTVSGDGATIVKLIILVLAPVFSLVAAMAISARYAQLDQAPAWHSVSPLNYAAIVLVIVVVPLAAMLSPKQDTSLMPDYDTPSTTNGYNSDATFY